MKTYAKSDYVTVVEGEGDSAVEYDVPKAWVGTELLPPGAKKKGGRSSSGSSSSSSSTSSSSGSGVPAKTETRDVLETYAVEKAGLTKEEAEAFSNKDELHDELVKRAGSTS